MRTQGYWSLGGLAVRTATVALCLAACVKSSRPTAQGASRAGSERIRTDAASLLGTWDYVDCTIKNTRVDGTISFGTTRTARFVGEVSQDYPTQPEDSTAQISVDDGSLEILSGSSIPVTEHFVVLGDELFFAWRPVSAADLGRDSAGAIAWIRDRMWVYRLRLRSRGR